MDKMSIVIIALVTMVVGSTPAQDHLHEHDEIVGNGTLCHIVRRRGADGIQPSRGSSAFLPIQPRHCGYSTPCSERMRPAESLTGE